MRNFLNTLYFFTIAAICCESDALVPTRNIKEFISVLIILVTCYNIKFKRDTTSKILNFARFGQRTN